MPRISQQYCCASFHLLNCSHSLTVVFFLLTIALLFPISSLAQSSTATLTGTVQDENGAVIAGVSIALINADQGTQRLATTDSEGTFVFLLLPPGKYSLTATREGFAPIEMKSVVLNLNDQAVLKIQLRVGAITQTVDVTDSTNLINQSPAVATVVDRNFVANIPLNGRTFQPLITLSPGVVLTKSTLGSEGQFSVNGQRANANYFTVDGVSANASAPSTNVLGQSAGSLPGLSAFGSTNNLVSVDALQEFKIQTSTYAAEFGRTPGAQVQILTRSGTNEFRGSAFEYFRNEVLDANDWFNNARGLRKPPLRQNDFGAVFGGPIIRNRTFFFFSYEGLRLRLPNSASIRVPSLSARQDAPASLKPFVNLYPLPTGPENPANRTAPFAASYSDPSTLDSTSIRIDHALNDKLTVFGRYSYAPSDSYRRANIFSENDRTISTTQYVTLGLTHSLSPRLINELRANYTRNKAGQVFLIDNFGGATPPDASSLFPSIAPPDKSLLLVFVAGLPFFQFGRNNVNIQRQVNLVDNLSVVAGAHQLKFGVDYRRLAPSTGPQEYSQVVNFSTGLIGNRGVLSGVANNVTLGAQDSVSYVFNNFSAYGQDTWRATRRLTLTYGLRWEVNPPPKGKGDQDLFTFVGLENPATLSIAPQGTPLWETTYNNFAPRFGIAYQLSAQQSRETMLRGGFGIFYDLGEGSSAQAALNFPYRRNRLLNRAAGFVNGVPYPLPLTLATPPAFTLNPPFGAVNAFDPNLSLPRTYQWNVSLDQSLGANQIVSASYVGAAGRDLLRQELLQLPNPNFSVVSVTKNTATSDYQALQLQFNRRLSRRFQALASYTWAKSLDTVSSDIGQDPPDRNIDLSQERGPSDFDVRHAFNGAVTYNIPTPDAGAFGNAILRDWSVDAIFTARSATPVNVIYIGVPSFGALAGSALRPDLLQGVPLYLSDSTVGGGRRINPAAFEIPSTERQGTLGRNSLRGFPVYQTDFALRRQFNLTERVNLQFRTEFFNIFNHPNFGDPDGKLGDFFGVLIPNPTFGQSTSMLGRSLGTGGTSGGLNPLFQVGGPRSIQFGLKFSF
jgi:hypothetical protein